MYNVLCVYLPANRTSVATYLNTPCLRHRNCDLVSRWDWCAVCPWESDKLLGRTKSQATPVISSSVGIARRRRRSNIDQFGLVNVPFAESPISHIGPPTNAIFSHSLLATRIQCVTSLLNRPYYVRFDDCIYTLANLRFSIFEEFSTTGWYHVRGAGPKHFVSFPPEPTHSSSAIAERSRCRVG